MEWLPNGVLAVLADVPAAAMVLLANLTLQAPSCGPLWRLQADECTMRMSAFWPSKGLEAGPAFVRYRRLHGRRSMAESVLVTCPEADWPPAGVAPKGPGPAPAGPNASAPALSSPPGFLQPCGTAVVTDGSQLLAAVEALQAVAQRVLVTLDANITLPCTPTEQLSPSSPDDASPLVRVYRNVTLAGLGRGTLGATPSAGTGATPGAPSEGSSGVATQLDVGHRRNVFGLADGDAAVLVFADMNVVNPPPGPPDTWPWGLTSGGMWHVGLNRSTTSIRMVNFRVQLALAPGQVSYYSYWYSRLLSLVPAEQASAQWLLGFITPQRQVLSDEGAVTLLGLTGSFLAKINMTILSRVAVPGTPQLPVAFDPWRLDDPPVPHGAVVVAYTLGQVQDALQEVWTGTRVIAMMANMSLVDSSWPADGYLLSSSVTFSGPTSGPPVLLDTAGRMRLRVPPGLTASWRSLRLRSLSWPVSWALPAAPAAVPGVPGYEQWRASCLPGFLDSSTGQLKYVDCTTEAPAPAFALIWRYNRPVCRPAQQLQLQLPGATATSPAPATPSPPPATCVLAAEAAAAAPVVPPELSDLVTRLMSTSGQPLALDNRTILAVSGGVGSVVLINTSTVLISGPVPGLAPGDTAGSAAGDGGGGSCDFEGFLQLLIAAQSTPPGASELLPGPGGGATAGAPGGGRAVNTGAAVGGAVGGFVGLLAVTSAVYLFVARRRRRNGANLPAAKNGSSTLPDSAALGAGPGSMGDSGKPGQGPAAARCSPLLKLLRMARPAGGGGGGAGSAAGAAAWDQLPQSPARSLAAARGGGQAAGGGNGKGPHEPTASILLAPEPGPRDVKTPAALPVPLSPQPQGRQQQQQQQQEEEQQEQVPARRGVGAPAVLNTAGLEAGAEADAAGAGGWPGRGVGAGSAGAWRWHTDTAGTDDQEQELELELQQEDASAFSASFAAQGRSNSQTAGAGVPGGLAGGSVRPGSVGPPGGGGGGGSAMVTMMDHMLGSVASRQGQAQGQAGGRAPVVPGSRLGAAGSLSPLLNTQQQLRLPPSRQPSGGPGTGGTGTGMVTTALVLTGGGSTGGMSTSGEVTRNMLAAEIDTMIRRIQETTVSSMASRASQAPGPRVLGRGGFGVVYRGEWRGLPVAIKVVLLQDGDSPARRERLVREVALTATLSHPHVVPTYHYTITPVLMGSLDEESGSWGLGRPPRHVGLEPAEELGVGTTGTPLTLHGIPRPGPGEPGPEGGVTAYKLSIIMAYCDRGTLRDAVAAGLFNTPLPTAPLQQQSQQQHSWEGPGPGASQGAGDGAAARGGSGTAGGTRVGSGDALPALPGPLRLPAHTESDRAAGRSPDSSQLQGAAPQSGQGAPPLPPLPPPAQAGSAGHGSVGMVRGSPEERPLGARLTWADVRVAANLPLALFAALDIARGLAYLHACCVVHGDLTPNNILLRSAEPLLPSPAAASTATGAASSTGTASISSSRRAGTATASASAEPSTDAASSCMAHAVVLAGRVLGPQLLSPLEPVDSLDPLADSEPVLLRGPTGGLLQTPPQDQEREQSLEGSWALDGTGDLRAPSSCASLGSASAHPGRSQLEPELTVAAGVGLATDDADVDANVAAALAAAAAAAAGGSPALQGSGGPVAVAPAACMASGSSGAGGAQPASGNPGSLSLALGQLGVVEGEEAAEGAACHGAWVGAGDADEEEQQQQQIEEEEVQFGLAEGTAPAPDSGAGGSAAAEEDAARSPFVGPPPSRTPGQPAGPGAGGGVAGGSWRARGGAAGGSASCSPYWQGQGQAQGRVLGPSPSGLTASAQLLMGHVFKISDFGLSVRLEQGESHLSNMHQGTPFFTAAEVLMAGKVSPASDVYSFGVILWCLAHSVLLSQLRHLLPGMYSPVGPTLLAHASPRLPPGLMGLLRRCLAAQPGARPSAAALVEDLKQLLQAAAGPELSALLLTAERRERDVGSTVAGLHGHHHHQHQQHQHGQYRQGQQRR